jgi:hypothetical protein
LLNKILAVGVAILLVGRLFFRPQFRALQTWFNGVTNAMLIAIAVVYLLQGVLWWFR